MVGLRLSQLHVPNTLELAHTLVVELSCYNALSPATLSPSCTQRTVQERLVRVVTHLRFSKWWGEIGHAVVWSRCLSRCPHDLCQSQIDSKSSSERAPPVTSTAEKHRSGAQPETKAKLSGNVSNWRGDPPTHAPPLDLAGTLPCT